MASTNLNDILTKLGQADQIVTLGIQIGTEAYTLVNGIIQGITKLKTSDGSETYALVLQTGTSEISDADTNYDYVITKVNEERAKSNLPPV